MKPSSRLLRKLTAALFILIPLLFIGSFVITFEKNSLFKSIANRSSNIFRNQIGSYLEKVRSNFPKKVVSVKTETEEQEPTNKCLEKETLKKAKYCTLLIGNLDKHGSGFVVNINSFVDSDSELAGFGNYLVTNYHVIDHYNDGYAQVYYNNDFNSSRIAGFSVENDLAIIEISQGLLNCDWANSQDMELAENVYAIGWPNSPFGESTITKGVFSRYVELGDNNTKMVQTDTPINPGNSGGPLINKCGVVGINTSKVSWIDESAPSEGIGYAISSNFAQEIILALIKNDDGSAKIPTEKIAQTQQKQPRSPKDSNQNQNNINYPNPNSLVDYDYDQVMFWEDQKLKNEARLKSWEKAQNSEFIDQEKYGSLINKIYRSLEISEKLWDGYTNSKITYLQVLNLKEEYFILSKEIMYLANDLNLQGSINAYKNCVDSWKSLEKEYEKDFSEQIEKCEEIIDLE